MRWWYGGEHSCLPKKERILGGGVGSNIKLYIHGYFGWNIKVILSEYFPLKERGLEKEEELARLPPFLSLLDRRWRG